MDKPKFEVGKYSPGAIVNYFLQKSWKEGRPITHLELQKLVYFAHAWHLALKGQPLIDEPFEAWFCPK